MPEAAHTSTARPKRCDCAAAAWRSRRKPAPPANRHAHYASGDAGHDHAAAGREQFGARFHDKRQNGADGRVDPHDDREADRHARQGDTISKKNGAHAPAEAVRSAFQRGRRAGRPQRIGLVRQYQRSHGERYQQHHDQRGRDVDILQFEAPPLFERQGQRASRHCGDQYQRKA